MKINLATSIGNEEFIFSDSGGKVLLDTLTPYPNALVASLKTSQTLVDLTTISTDAAHTSFGVTTYKAINPLQWTSIDQEIPYANDYPNLGYSTAQIVYSNTPPVPNGYVWLNDYVNGINYTSVTPLNGVLTVSFSQYNPGNYVYLYLPASGLYNFHVPTGSSDTVDLSTMDAAVQVSYPKPAGYSSSGTFLYGIMDTTNVDRTVCLYSNFGGLVTPDVAYPQKVVQKMELYMGIFSGSNLSDDYYSYGDSVPSSIIWPTSSDFTISSSASNAFSVAFNNVKPTFYLTSWGSGNIYFVINASPDSSSINPQSMLSSLNSKLLQGQNLSGLTLQQFTFGTADGLDYTGYCSRLHNTAQLKTLHFSSLLEFNEHF